MPVVLCFQRIPEAANAVEKPLKAFLELLSGPYMRVDILVIASGLNTVYSIPNGGVFCRERLSATSFSDQTHDFLMVPCSLEEDYCIWQTCEACVESKIKHNLKDVLMAGLPFRWPHEKPLFQCYHLYCSQSVVLILRECLSPDNPLVAVLMACHSRQVTATSLYNTISNHCIITYFKSFISSFVQLTVNSKTSTTTSAEPISKTDKLKPGTIISSKGSKLQERWDMW